MDLNTLAETLEVNDLTLEELEAGVLDEDVLEEVLESGLAVSVEVSKAEHLAKLSQYLKNLTPEQRAEMRKKADETRRLKRVYGETHYQHVWMDDRLWRQMAKVAGVRLADQYTVPTPYKLSRFARQLNLSFSWKEALFGVNANKGVTYCLAQEFEQQPEGKKYNLRFYQGILLECKYGATFKNDHRIADDEDIDEQVDESLS